MSSINPVDEYLLLKEAANGVATATSGNSWGPALRNAAIQGGVGLAVAAAPFAANAVYNAVAKRGRYNQMLEHNEDLHAMREEDPKRFNQFYSSLHSMSPEFAGDPIVAGTYMRQMMANPSGAGKVLVEARSGAKNLPTSPMGDSVRGLGQPMGKAIVESLNAQDAAAAKARAAKAQAGGAPPPGP